MNIIKILSLVSAIPAFLTHAGQLESEATSALKNPQLIAELEANPTVKAVVTEISAEWRSVENDATSVEKSNILTFFPRAGRFLADAGHLVANVDAAELRSDLAQAIDGMPLLRAEIAVISAQWRAVQNDIGGFVA